jgi:alkylation response protein AidB-like acyl-CoA dehydrogenase
MPLDAAQPRKGSDWIAPDCSGWDFWATDRGLRDLLAIYLPADVRTTLEPHWARLGVLAGGRLDELARTADKHGPILHPRDRFGRDEEWIEYHPAYREMEQIAFGDFQFHAMVHRGGVLGMDRPLPPVAKYAFQYLFVQGEFGLMCPISVTDTSIHLIRKFGSNSLQDYLLPKMLSNDMTTFWKGTQFMTEKAGGSDVGAIETEARLEDGVWRLYGDKWFCSHADADVALMLARPAGAPSGTKGLALFALPRRTMDGKRNAYRIVRLKDKLGTKCMASGEILLQGAEAYLVGQQDQGLKQMMEQVNLSRLSHGVRAAAMMRRCVNEALAATRGRTAFGRQVVEFPLMRRQLMKLLVPTEQALSMSMCTADAMGRSAGDGAVSTTAKEELRILTGLLKLRACRDNVPVAIGALEARGGNGAIEDWVNPRLVRDAPIGLLWEGTSNINALDIVTRAVAKSKAHLALQTMLHGRLAEASALPSPFRNALGSALDRAVQLAERVAESGLESLARQASTALYDAASAVLMGWEATRPGADARRALLARFVLAHRLSPSDPLAPEEADWERPATDALLGERAMTVEEIGGLLI